MFLYAFDLLELNGQDMRREPLEVRKRVLAAVLWSKVAGAGIQFNEHCDDLPAAVVFRHACKLGFEGIVSKRLGSPYRSGRSRDWLKMKNPNAPAVKREAESDWGNKRWRLASRLTLDVDADLRFPRGPHTDSRLCRDPRGRHGGVR